jgi:hypothetical protein
MYVHFKFFEQATKTRQAVETGRAPSLQFESHPQETEAFIFIQKALPLPHKYEKR